MAGLALRNRMRGLETLLILAGSQFTTLLGSAMSRFALGVYLYQRTGQVQSLAAALVVGSVPGILLTPFAGVWTDRSGPRRLVLAGDVMGGLAVASLVIAALAGHISVAHILAVTAILSCASALQTPALRTLVPILAPRDKVTQANGIFSTITSVTDVLGPPAAGAVLALSGLAPVLVFDLVTYVATVVITILIWSRLGSAQERARAAGRAPGAPPPNSWSRDLREGIQYLLSRRPLLLLVLLFTGLNFAVGFNSVLGQPFVLSMGNSQQLGILNALFGAGMVLGGVVMSTVKLKSGLIRTILLGNLWLGVSIALSGFSRNLWLVGSMWLITGLMLPVVNTVVVAIMQLATDPNCLGRVFALARMLAWASLPVGQILAGQLADSLIRHDFPGNALAHWLAGLFPAGKQGSYGLLLVCTGLFVVMVTAAFSLPRSLYQLEGETIHES